MGGVGVGEGASRCRKSYREGGSGGVLSVAIAVMTRVPTIKCCPLPLL